MSPRPRAPKTRVEHLADAVEALQAAQKSLGNVDLRKVPKTGGLRGKISNARTATDGALDAALEAIKADVPAPLEVAG